ncbi:MAG TPA: PAS domain-containing protein [Firmicutes bacterium]|nr:PAS domain-containing protein [Bacillota bacterium]
MEQRFTPSSFPEKAVPELLENIFTYAGEGMVLLGPDYKVIKVNDHFIRQSPTPVRNWYGVDIDQLIPGFAVKLRGLCAQVQERKKPFVTERLKILPVFPPGQPFAGWLLLVSAGWEESFGLPARPEGQKTEDQGQTGQSLIDALQKRRIEQLLSAEAVLNNLPVGIAVYDSISLRLKWANSVYRGFMEGNKGALGRTLMETIPGVHENGLVRACDYVTMTGEPFVASEFRIDGFQRGVVYWRLTIIRLELTEAEAPALLFIVVDVTEQVKARKQQEDAEKIAESGLAQLEAVVNSLKEGIVITDPRCQVVFMNPAGMRMMGFNATEETLRPVAEYNRRYRFKELSGTALPPEASPFARPLRGGAFFDLELIVEDLSQDRTWIGNFSGTPVRNRKGELTLGVVVFRDITHAKQAEQEWEKMLAIEQKAWTEAERQDMQKQVLLDNIGEGVLVLAPNGRLLMANKVALAITGVQGWPETIEELLSPAALFRKDGSRLAPDELLTTRLRAGQYFTDEEYRLKRADGTERSLLISGNAVKDRQGQIFMNLVTIRDVTELRNLEQIREDYLHMVSHDLRSPLAVILSHAQLLGLIAKEETKIANSAQAIAVSALRMNNMIADLVDSTRIESGQLVLKTVCLDLDRFINDFLLRMQGVIAVKRIRLVKKEPLLPVVADPNRLERILVNLLSNALKYSPPDRPVEIEFWVDETRMVVAIRDEGQGISPDDLPRIFDRYYRAPAGGEEGIGLGLYIVKKLVEAHNGAVWVESTPGQGSTFYFTLPVVAPQDEK